MTGHHEHVGIGLEREARTRRGEVHPDADRPDGPLGSQAPQCRPRVLERVVDVFRIVQVEQVDLSDAQPQQAPFQRPQHPIPTQVADRASAARARSNRIPRSIDDLPPDFCCNPVALTFVAGERAAEHPFSLSCPIVVSCVEQGDPGG